MIGAVLFGLRFFFLAMFYLFLIKLTLAIIADLRQPMGEIANKTARGGDGAGLLVVASTDEHLPPETEIPLGGRTLFGRAKSSHVNIQDNFVSSKHAMISYRDNQYWLEDLGSLNGTYLNDIKLTQAAPLANGDQIRVGGVSFEFVRWAYEMEPDYRDRVSETE